MGCEGFGMEWRVGIVRSITGFGLVVGSVGDGVNRLVRRNGMYVCIDRIWGSNRRNLGWMAQESEQVQGGEGWR